MQDTSKEVCLLNCLLNFSILSIIVPFNGYCVYGMGHGRVGGAEMQEASAFYDVSREPPPNWALSHLRSLMSFRRRVFVAAVARQRWGFSNLLCPLFFLDFNCNFFSTQNLRGQSNEVACP